jgi:hypothetical protein
MQQCIHTDYTHGVGPRDLPCNRPGQIEVEFCPIHGTDHRVVDSDSVPSMLGYGSDDSVKLACGHSLTWDPFTGKPFAR